MEFRADKHVSNYPKFEIKKSTRLFGDKGVTRYGDV